MGKNVIIFGADMSSSLHIDNKGKDILILGEGPTQGLDDTTLTAEAKYSINFSRSQRIYVYEFSVDYNTVDTSNIIDIHKYLMKKYDIK